MASPWLDPYSPSSPDDEQSYVIDDEFLLGPSLLVAPILTPGARARAVYLPKVKWFDVWSGRVLGPGWILAEAPLNRIPLFLREDGAVVATEPRESASEPWSKVSVEALVHTKACATLYDDNGESMAFKNGRFFEAVLCIERRGDTAKVSVERLHMGFTPGFEKIEIRVLNGEWVERMMLRDTELKFRRVGGTAVAELSLSDIIG